MNSNIGWTVQSKQGWIEDHGAPGNTFTEDQLPHPELQRSAGINPEKYRAQHGLWVDGPGENRRPEFLGTETGQTPDQILAAAGDMESFASYTVQNPPVEESTEA